jgi:glycosyltransferase involved in cell wall biosynthesis
MPGPLVTVIALCYNHERFVARALQSLFAQDYQPLEIIVVDDASTDSSVDIIRKTIAVHPHVRLIELRQNVGNCKAFNIGFRQSRGAFVIDFATDDELAPDRLSQGVDLLQGLGSRYGVAFGDAELISEKGDHLAFHSDRFPARHVPQGDVYRHVIRRYFINAATMIVRREVLEQLNGYDESLAYEDFDFLVRASRHYLFAYQAKVAIKKRMVARSMGQRQWHRLAGRAQRESTFLVCQKAFLLNRNRREQNALLWRLLYEIKSSLNLRQLGLAVRFARLFMRVAIHNPQP